jgi:hypothetical protein
MVALLKDARVLEGMRVLLVRAGVRDLALPDVRLRPTPTLIEQLVADGTHQGRVRTRWLEAEGICLMPVPLRYVMPGAGDGNVLEASETDTFGTAAT